MSMPFYVSPEQIMKDKSDYARKGIARGRSVLAMQYADGILFIGENPNGALHKISEIYDRIAFAAVGKYNEFENLRLAGVRYADLRGYQYDRRDVTSRGLANAYAQTLGTIFTESGKPYEVELVVAEVGDTQAEDQMYRLTYDGSVAEEHGFIVMGGNSDPIATHVRERHDATAPLSTALKLAVAALVLPIADGTETRTIAGDDLEAAVLDRTRPRRAFKRLVGAPLQKLLESKK
jgi:proteasome alpha subunit